MLIWQEFQTIVSDVWSKARWICAVIASYHQPITVMAVGTPISLYLTGLPILAALDNLVSPFRYIYGDENGIPSYRGGNGIAFLLMFFLGCVVFALTVELTDRILKRLEGKSKDDSGGTGAA